jgi:hypothetical protein
MAEQTLTAASNPALANKLAEEALNTTPETKPEPAKIKSPSSVTVDLPGGYISPETGEVLRTADVRELNGKDEEMVTKASTISKALLSVLNRGTISIGNLPATEEILDNLLVADRDAISIGIYRATFGDSAEFATYCSGCEDAKIIGVDIVNDIKIKRLTDPIEERVFDVQGRNTDYKIKLPEGKAQRELASNNDYTPAELDTVLLEYCVLSIGGKPVLGKSQIQSIGLADRRAILKTIIEKNPGPQFDDVKATCPDCGGEVVVPISLGTLFRF